MDRPIVFQGQLPLETDILRLGQYAMVGVGKIAESMLGAGTFVDGFTLSPTAPASLSLNLGPGQVYEVENLEATALSSIPVDTHSIVKQGINLDPTTLTFTPPTTTGYSQCFLVEAQYQDTDTGAVVRPYYNASNPAIPYQGPGNAGTADNTVRKGVAAIQVKAGIASTAGTQIVPSPDAGWAGMFVVTLSYGATTATAGNIALYSGAPFITPKLPAVPAGVQSGTWVYAGTSTSSGNAFTVSLTPAPQAFPVGMGFRATMNAGPTGPATIIVNGSTFSVTLPGNNPLAGGEWNAGDVVDFKVRSGSSVQINSGGTEGATAQGGLAKDSSKNFLLALINNLTADSRTAPVAADILALGRAADGAMVGVSAAKLATYILSNIVASATFQQIVPNPTLYVDAVNGLDTNPGTQAAPFKTIGAALAAGTSKYTFTSGTLTIQLINGSPSNLFTPPTGAIPVGSGIILIQGDIANPQNYVISGSGPAGGSSSILQAQSTVQILGLTVQNTSANNSSFGVSGNGSLYLQNVASQTTQSTSGAHFSCVGASLTFGGGVTATGNAANLISATSGAKPTIFGTLQIVGSATFSNATLYYDLNSAVVVEPGAAITTTGTVTAVKYLGYRSSACRILNGQAGNAFPGSTAGTADATTFASYG